METSPPNVMSIRDLLGLRIVFWNVLLHRLANVKLENESDEFLWNLHENGKFSINSMYNILVQSDVLVDKNSKLWKLKIPLKIKVFG
jgi:hypothetical protein